MSSRGATAALAVVVAATMLSACSPADAATEGADAPAGAAATGSDAPRGTVDGSRYEPDAGAADGVAASAPSASIATLADAGWVADIAQRSGIPPRALAAYAGAAIAVARRHPSCGLGWNTLAAIADTDRGALDGDTTWDRAVGPMQFIPSTWLAYRQDGDGDGRYDVNQIDDAALTAGVYLCEAGGDLTDPARWIAAVHAYNADLAYNNRVADAAAHYAAFR